MLLSPMLNFYQCLDNFYSFLNQNNILSHTRTSCFNMNDVECHICNALTKSTIIPIGKNECNLGEHSIITLCSNCFSESIHQRLIELKKILIESYPPTITLRRSNGNIENNWKIKSIFFRTSLHDDISILVHSTENEKMIPLKEFQLWNR